MEGQVYSWASHLMPLAGPLLTIAVFTFWHYTDNTRDEFRRIDAKFDSKFDSLNRFITDNLISLNRDIGELKAASPSHTP